MADEPVRKSTLMGVGEPTSVPVMSSAPAPVGVGEHPEMVVQVAAPPAPSPPPPSKPSLRERAWTLLGGRSLEEASAEDLSRAGIGVRPMRKATEEASAKHIRRLKWSLRFRRLLPFIPVIVTLLALGGVSLYLLLKR